MSSGVIFTSLVSFFVFGSAFFSGFSIWRKRKVIDKFFTPFSYFLLVTGIAWFFVGVRLIFGGLGMMEADRVIFMIDQVFIMFSGVILYAYFGLRFLKKERTIKLIVLVFSFVFIVFLFFLFYEGVTQGEITHFASKFRPGKIAFGIFIGMIIPLLLAGLYDILTGFIGWIRWIRKKAATRSYNFVYSLTIFVYLILGIFDEQGSIAGWQLVLFRLLFAAVFLAAYLLFHYQFLKVSAMARDGQIEEEQFISARRGAIFRKFLIILILLSLIPVAFSSFLTISTYRNAFISLEERGLMPLEEVLQLQYNVLIQIFLVLFLLVILVIFTGILVARGITRPLSALVQGVNEVSKGNLDVQFRIKSKDELGELAFAFNEMILKLQEQRAREQLVANLKTEFISIAAHQLRTPLSSVKWILKMLLDGDFGPLSLKQREFVEKGYEANSRMVHLVNDLLDISRIEEGRFGFEFATYDFSKFLRETVSAFKEDAVRRNVDLRLEIDNEPVNLIFDPQRLKMAVSNLVDNAIRYTQPRGKVVVSLEKQANLIRVLVKDSGAGIPEHQKDRVFTKFFRGDNVVRMQTEGTGLGLYLTRNIIEKHGGKIWFESTEGKGTSFFFTIPKRLEISSNII